MKYEKKTNISVYPQMLWVNRPKWRVLHMGHLGKSDNGGIKRLKQGVLTRLSVFTNCRTGKMDV